MEKQTSSSGRVLVACVSTGVLMLCTALVTLYVARQFYSEAICSGVRHMPTLHFGKKAEFEQTVRLTIEEKGVTVARTGDNDRCYVMPINKSGKERTLALIHEPLSSDMLEELAGEDAVEFCEDRPAYLLKDLHAMETARTKRQSAAASRASGLDKKYEERTPRCMDLILDCSADGAIGQKQECYTWINGVILKTQECLSETSFKIFMEKPPGRILKIAQRQWKICYARRTQGLRC